MFKVFCFITNFSVKGGWVFLFVWWWGFFFNNMVANVFSFPIYHQRNTKAHHIILCARLPADASFLQN